MLKRLKVIGGCGLVFSVLLFFALQFVRPKGAWAQTQRQVDPHAAFKNEPVVVTKITYRNTKVQSFRSVKGVGENPDPVTPFQAGDAWVQDLTVYLLNRTNQTIVHASFTFSFPETTNWATRFRAVFPLTVGRIPDAFAFEDGRAISQRPDAQPISFGPGQVMAIHLGDYIDRIRADVEPSQSLSQLSKMDVGMVSFFFADGLRWSGSFRVLDQQTKTWQRADPNFFPGNQDARLPGLPGWVEQ